MPETVVSRTNHSGQVTEQTSRQKNLTTVPHLHSYFLAFLAVVVEQVQHGRKASAKC